jgi:hypothetical protein
MALTEISMREPFEEKAGRLAVTITAATFLVCIVWPRVLVPIRSSMVWIESWVKGAFFSESPVPLRPTTRP